MVKIKEQPDGETRTVALREQPAAPSWFVIRSIDDAIKIADIVGVKVISLDEAPTGYAQFDAGAPVKFVIDPHGQLKR